MPFQLIEANPATDFEELIRCEWESYEEPAQTFFRLFGPIHGNDRAESMKECTARQLLWHTSDETSYWQKVVKEDGKIVAGALWKICPKNPFEKHDDHDVDWYPEGETRDYARECLKPFDAYRTKNGARPQVYLNIIFTHPDYRRQGIADLILNWGKQKADEMDVEMWLDATIYGKPVYLKHGFAVMNRTALAPDHAGTPSEPGEEWKEIEKALQPMELWQMWRPRGGDYVEGVTVKPWEQVA